MKQRAKRQDKKLRARKNSQGVSLDTLVGQPEFMPDRWIRLPWLPFGGSKALARLTSARWKRAWHGSKMEALHSIAYYGQLVESSDASRGERFFDGSPGIYIYKDELARKVEFYCRFVQLGMDGVFWAHKWELLVNREDRVKPPHNTRPMDSEAKIHATCSLMALWTHRKGNAPRGGLLYQLGSSFRNPIHSMQAR